VAKKPPRKAIERLCVQLDVDPRFFVVCLEESIIEVTTIKGRLDLGNGTVLRLRRLQRICATFDMDPQMALLLLKTSP
jgi:hypothetical protein